MISFHLYFLMQFFLAWVALFARAVMHEVVWEQSTCGPAPAGLPLKWTSLEDTSREWRRNMGMATCIGVLFQSVWTHIEKINKNVRTVTHFQASFCPNFCDGCSLFFFFFFFYAGWPHSHKIELSAVFQSFLPLCYDIHPKFLKTKSLAESFMFLSHRNFYRVKSYLYRSHVE